MAIHTGILARVLYSGTEEPGRPQSMGSQRAGQNRDRLQMKYNIDKAQLLF